MYKEGFKEFLKGYIRFFIIFQNYVNAELDKHDVLMNLKKQNANNGNRIVSRNMVH